MLDSGPQWFTLRLFPFLTIYGVLHNGGRFDIILTIESKRDKAECKRYYVR